MKTSNAFLAILLMAVMFGISLMNAVFGIIQDASIEKIVQNLLIFPPAGVFMGVMFTAHHFFGMRELKTGHNKLQGLAASNPSIAASLRNLHLDKYTYAINAARATNNKHAEKTIYEVMYKDVNQAKKELIETGEIFHQSYTKSTLSTGNEATDNILRSAGLSATPQLTAGRMTVTSEAVDSNSAGTAQENMLVLPVERNL